MVVVHRLLRFLFFGEKKEGKKRGKKNMVKTLGREM
jgi:hypothetical protein